MRSQQTNTGIIKYSKCLKSEAPELLLHCSYKPHCGYSHGGWVAVRTASVLQGAGYPVLSVIVLDSY